jgi:hypothetical protein
MFSGTGSKILKALANEEILIELTKTILANAGLKAKYLEISLVSEPKEATCNGGLAYIDIESSQGVKNSPEYIYTCIKGKEIHTRAKGEEEKKFPYSDYENGIADIKENLMDFHKFFFELNKQVNFSDYFGIPSKITEFVQKNYEELLGKWLGDSIKKNKNLEGIKNEENISETPFFMPIKSIILELSKKIAEGKL